MPICAAAVSAGIRNSRKHQQAQVQSLAGSACAAMRPVALAQAILPRALGARKRLTRRNQAGKKRQEAIARHEAFWQEIEKQNKIAAIFKKHDVSKTGSLNREELGAMLQELAGGEAPTEEELTFVLITADATDKKMDGEIGHHELETAIAVWNRYLHSKPDIDIIFEKFDKNQSSKLEAKELKAFLTELNDDIEPTDQEVQFILDSSDGAVEGISKTGGINRTELTQAISLWYAHTDKVHRKCCSIM